MKIKSFKRALTVSTMCLSASLACAQVPTDDIKVGTLLDAKGIKLSTFGKPLPLPPGSWEVVSRLDSEIKLTGGNFSSAARVALTVRNTNPAEALAAMVLTYTPDSISIRWGGSRKCESLKAAVVDSFGSNGSSLTYACVTAYFNSNGFKKLVTNAPDNVSPWIKTNLSPLTPYALDMPDANIWSNFEMNRDRGRSISFTFIARSLADLKAGDKLDTDSRAWIKSTGQAYIDFLEGNASVVQAFPLAHGVQVN